MMTETDMDGRWRRAPREVRAIRGAITVDADVPALVLEATALLLRDMLERNSLSEEDVVSAFLTVTPDLTSAFPACAARELGWSDIPLMCAQEIPVPGALERCVRVMLHVLTDRPRSGIVHSYLRGAVALRPDLVASASDGDSETRGVEP